mmetsp:Transcript_7138/g.18490  ORF Transcript_7138/g.18490 Transcript_7138/m.18490 type:complete len:447 (+) Transcript_7138:48-1388(+)
MAAVRSSVRVWARAKISRHRRFVLTLRRSTPVTPQRDMGRGAFGMPRSKGTELPQARWTGKETGENSEVDEQASAMAAQPAGQPRTNSEGDEPVVCRPCAEPQTTKPSWWHRLTTMATRTAWRLRGRRVSRERSQRSQRAWAIGGEWRSDVPVEDFEKNTDPTTTHVVRTNQGKWETSSHCFQCALNTVHECHDFGEDIHTFPGIERKWLSASVSEKVHYPRVRYLVSYPPRTPQLPYHDHPGGEEYLVFSGSFCDTNFPDVKAPAFVRYPIGTHHAAMTEPSSERTDILCWWGLMQATSSTESGRSVQLDPQTLTPSGIAPEAVAHRLVWPLSKDGIETRIERWDCDVKLTWRRPHKEIFVLKGRVSIDGEDLGEGDWCSLPVGTEASSFHVLAPATVLVKELWPMDGWRTPRFRDVGWASWKGGRVGGQGLVERPEMRRALTTV